MLSEADLSITKDAFSLAMKTKEEETDRVIDLFYNSRFSGYLI